MNHNGYKFKEQELNKKITAPKINETAYNASFDVGKDTEIDKKLRVPRSEVYMQLFDLVDLLGSNDEEIIARLKGRLDADLATEISDMSEDELREEIRSSFTEEFDSMQVETETILYGVLAKCYITGCDCHAIDSEGYILDHYSKNDPIPQELAKGRPLLLKYGEACRCVEVYNNCCRVVMDDSSVVTINDNELTI